MADCKVDIPELVISNYLHWVWPGVTDCPIDSKKIGVDNPSIWIREGVIKEFKDKLT
jgi:hypothetical protein